MMRICWLLCIVGWVALFDIQAQRESAAVMDNQELIAVELEIQLDSEHQSVAGTQRLRLRLRRAARQVAFLLDERLRLVHVKDHGQALSIQRQGDTVLVDLGQTLKAGAAVYLEILYGGQPKPAAEIWAGGNVSLDASLLPPWAWWPCVPGPVDSLKLHVIYPQEAAVMTSGILLALEKRPGCFLRRTFVYPYPTRPEQVRLYAGDLQKDTVAYQTQGTAHTLHYLSSAHDQVKMKAGMKQLTDALASLEAQFGPYPFWDRPFYWVSAPSSAEQALNLDGAMIRRLAGHWFGRYIRPSDELARLILRSLAAYAEIAYVEKRFDRKTALRYLFDQPEVPIGPCLWEALRNQLGDDERWWAMLRALPEDLADQSVNGPTLISYLATQLGHHPGQVVEQYLLYQQRPRLQYRLLEDRRRTSLFLRWNTQVPELPLEVRFEVGKETQSIAPTDSWQKFEFKRTEAKKIVPAAGQQYLLWEYAEP